MKLNGTVLRLRLFSLHHLHHRLIIMMIIFFASFFSGSVAVSVPDLPVINSVVRGNGIISLFFNPPVNDGGSQILNYFINIYYSHYSCNSLNSYNFFVTESSPYIASGLPISKYYAFKIAAVNSIGSSGYTGLSSCIYNAAVPNQPTITSVSMGRNRITVDCSSNGDGGEAISNFLVKAFYASNNSLVNEALGYYSVIISGLRNGVAYYVQAQAANVLGYSVLSVPYSFNLVIVPDPPTNLTVTRGNKLFTVEFIAPLYNGGDSIISYTVNAYFFNSYYNSYEFEKYTSGTSSPIVISSLRIGVSYKLGICATNNVGNSVESSIWGFIFSTVPEAPTGVSASISNSQAFVSFTIPASPTGAPIRNFFIKTYKASDNSLVSGTTYGPISSPALITGLIIGTYYYFKVQAVNDIGYSVESTKSGNILFATKPEAPSIFLVTRASGQISVSFITNSDGGSPILSYTIKSFIRSTNTFVSSISVMSSPALVSGLITGIAYYFKIYSSNSQGDSVLSDASNTIVFAVIPAPPTDVNVTRGKGEVSVGFKIPASDGGLPITAYRVFVQLMSSNNNYTSWSTGSNSPIIVKGLSLGSIYRFKVMASNDVGNSTLSEASAIILVADVPSSPTWLTAALTLPGNMSITVSFSASASDGGDPIILYVARAYKVSDGLLYSETYGTSSPILVSNLISGFSYYFRVAASNKVGYGFESLPSANIFFGNSTTSPDLPGNWSCNWPNGALVVGPAVSFDSATSFDYSMNKPFLNIVINVPSLYSGASASFSNSDNLCIGNEGWQLRAVNRVHPCHFQLTNSLNWQQIVNGSHCGFHVDTISSGIMLEAHLAISTTEIFLSNGENVTRSNEQSLVLHVLMPTQFTTSSGSFIVVKPNPLSFFADIVSTLFNTTLKPPQILLQLSTTISWPFKLANATISSAPVGVLGIAGLNYPISSMSCADSSSKPCYQNWTISLKNVCNYTGSYLVKFSVGCQPSFPASCSNGTLPTTLDANIFLTDFDLCNKDIDLPNPLSGSLSLYRNGPFTVFQLAYFRLECVNSLQMTISSVIIDSISLLSNTNLMVGGQITSLGQSTNLQLINSNRSNELYFSFNLDPILFNFASQSSITTSVTVVANVSYLISPSSYKTVRLLMMPGKRELIDNKHSASFIASTQLTVNDLRHPLFSTIISRYSDEAHMKIASSFKVGELAYFNFAIYEDSYSALVKSVSIKSIAIILQEDTRWLINGGKLTADGELSEVKASNSSSNSAKFRILFTSYFDLFNLPQDSFQVIIFEIEFGIEYFLLNSGSSNRDSSYQYVEKSDRFHITLDNFDVSDGKGIISKNVAVMLTAWPVISLFSMIFCSFIFLVI